MTSSIEKLAGALELLPEELRGPAIVYLVEQAEKYRVLKALIADGIDDLDNGRVEEWNVDDFLSKVRASEDDRGLE